MSTRRAPGWFGRAGRSIAGLALAGMVSGGGLALVMRYRNPYRPVLERISFRLPVGHEALAGLRIGFITDTHLNPYFSRKDLERGLSLLAAEAPDLLLLGGDYISEATRYIDEAAPPLGQLARATPLGALAVLGNHDLGGHGQAVIDGLKAEGIRVLRNEAVAVPWNGDELWVAGTDDDLLGKPLPSLAFAAVPTGAAVLSLWHEPDSADRAVAFQPFAQLSGHSHGGQIRLPRIGEMAVPVGGRKYPVGHYDVDGMQLYTSRGLGTYRPPVRFRCQPEVTLVTLVAADPAT
ncbi:MAG TPA: metallophosphoesterase [Thermomicrobiales bacterium]|nr:metallophosphoesterase [Thermomicrobiales bacterium]